MRLILRDARLRRAPQDEGSHPLHNTIHHALLARLVEADGQLVAVDGGDVAVAEFLVEAALFRRFRLGAERHGRDHRVGGILLKLGVRT